MQEVIFGIICDTDEKLQAELTAMVKEGKKVKLSQRLYCKVDDYDVEDKEKIKDKYKSFISDKDGDYILIGEGNDDYGEPKSGSKDFENKPYINEELTPYVEKYGVENIHVDFPRVDEKEIKPIIKLEVK